MEIVQASMDSFISSNPGVSAVLFFGGIILILVLATVFRRKCPSCGKYRAGEVVGTERADPTLLGTHRGKVKRTLRCKYCGHEWHAVETRNRYNRTSVKPPTPGEARAKIDQIEQALADPNYRVSDSVRRAMIESQENLKKYL